MSDASHVRFATIGLVAKPAAGAVAAEIGRLAAWLGERGLEVRPDTAAAELVGRQEAAVDRDELAGAVDLIVVLGGDGTLLSVARAAAAADVPVLGINYGSLGFLTSTPREEMYEVLPELLEGRYVASSRMMLRARVEGASGETGEDYDVLNDVVVNKTSLARLVDLAVTVDGDFVSRYRADGLIVATPTGSTAYSLAVGGPIVTPTMDATVISPISPHTLTNRPLVVPGSARIRVGPLAEEPDCVLTLDGQRGLDLREGDSVSIERSPHRFTLLTVGERSHFEVLRTKLHWGNR